tara:strand:- start:4778 stop:5839 length:1062 start_codon:yes stop_codon:yes gene_type:complete
MCILVTGAAGFIGFHISKRILNEGCPVIAYDNLNNYYDSNLKYSRIKELKQISEIKKVPFLLIKNDLESNKDLENAFLGKGSLGELFPGGLPKKVIHLAAQAGVRYSLKNPSAYINSNLVGFGNILENCRKYNVSHLIYASSSSVYGGNKLMPFSEKHSVDHPVSLYAATKKSNELMAHSYSHLFNLPTTGLRFFTVYGPWGRPDMALFIFTKSILKGEPINVFNNGNMIRDFTYIDDIVESIYRLIEKRPKLSESFDFSELKPSNSWAPYKIFNIGNSKPTPLMDYIKATEKALGKKAKINFEEMQPGDVQATAADTKLLENWTGFKPNTSIEDGVQNFVRWYLRYYGKTNS